MSTSCEASERTTGHRRTSVECRRTQKAQRPASVRQQQLLLPVVRATVRAVVVLCTARVRRRTVWPPTFGLSVRPSAYGELRARVLLFLLLVAAASVRPSCRAPVPLLCLRAFLVITKRNRRASANERIADPPKPPVYRYSVSYCSYRDTTGTVPGVNHSWCGTGVVHTHTLSVEPPRLTMTQQ